MQNTGNPVLDSVVNLLAGTDVACNPEALKDFHAAVLEIAQKEPGGLALRHFGDSAA